MRRSLNTAYGIYHNSAILPNTTSTVHQIRTIDRIRCTEKICIQCTLVQATEFAILSIWNSGGILRIKCGVWDRTQNF